MLIDLTKAQGGRVSAGIRVLVGGCMGCVRMCVKGGGREKKENPLTSHPESINNRPFV